MQKSNRIKCTTRIAAMLAALCLILNGTAALAKTTEKSKLEVTGYRVWRSTGSQAVEQIRKDTQVSVEVTVKRPDLKTVDVTGPIKVAVTSGSFQASKTADMRGETTSAPDEPLAIRLTFPDVRYTGKGDALNFKLVWSGGTDTGTVNLIECVEYETFSSRDSDDDRDKKDRKDTSYGAPLLLISRGEFGKSLAPGETFEMVVKIQNVSAKMTAANIVVGFETSEGLTLLDNTGAQYIRTLRPKASYSIKLRLQAQKELTNPSQSVSASLKFDYVENDQRAQSTTNEKLQVPFTVDGASKIASATPNLIVSKYSYGDKINVGQSFDLMLEFQNTSDSLPVENIVLSLETNEGLSITSASNTVYIPSLPAGGTRSEMVKMLALPMAKPESPRIDIGFKYEYVDQDKRIQATSNEKIAIPVYQPDRFKVTPPGFSASVPMNEEMSISVPYVNKSKSEVSNVEAELVGEIESLSTRQNLGNFEAGKSGTIDFIVTPREPGAQTLSVIVTYEDAALNVKTVEVPVSFEVEEAQIQTEEDIYQEPYQETKPNGWLLWAMGGLAALSVLVALFVRGLRSRAKRRQQKSLEIPMTAGEDGRMKEVEDLTGGGLR